ncbi:MAG: glycine--tRNA ligase subunit beta, partial [Alphaproteobacteria bacterium]
GPKVGAPEAALQGFLKSMGITLDMCTQVDGYWYARKEIAGVATKSLLGGLIENLLANFPWPKSMRWPGSTIRWVRPIRHIVCVFGGEAQVIDIPSVGLKTQGYTVGHRFLAPQAITVGAFADYKAQLEKAYVIVDQNERKKMICDQVAVIAQKQQLTWIEDQKLLDEVVGLVEYPFALLGRIDDKFTHLPDIVLETAMRVHQRYFALETAPGKLAPYFVAIADMPEKPEMLRGYERVLQARLSDANFFYEQDLKHSLEKHDLGTIVFYTKLGTVAQKVERLQDLVKSDDAKRSAKLCKSDLMTQMVREFPELQGRTGEIYAEKQGESAAVAAAIREHYQPLGPNDECPSASASVELALADKIDTMVGFFGIGEIPSGSSDRYALRRAALGIIRLIRENELRDFDIQNLAYEAVAGYKKQGLALTHPNPTEAVYGFILERLAVALKAEGIRHDCFQAVKQRMDKIGPVAERARALHKFLETEAGQALFTAARRVSSILKDVPDEANLVNETLFAQAEENKLYEVIKALPERLVSLLSKHDYDQAMQALSETRGPVDAFFDKVTVNTDDPTLRQNRLALLHMLAALFTQVADFSQLEG